MESLLFNNESNIGLIADKNKPLILYSDLLWPIIKLKFSLFKPGIFPRLRNKLSQFNKVKYLWGMTADEIIKMLPKEFNPYKKNITKWFLLSNY